MSTESKYRTRSHATAGGRNGIAGLTDGKLTVRMTSPKDLGGGGREHNPEELFAVGHAACCLGAMRFAAQSEKLGEVPQDATPDAHVGIGPRDEGGLGLTVRLEVSLPGLDRETAERIVERGHFICPNSNATQVNIDVETVLS